MASDLPSAGGQRGEGLTGRTSGFFNLARLNRPPREALNGGDGGKHNRTGRLHSPG